ncbi:MAG: ABC transporter permease [Galactobacter sp.]
MTRYLLGRLGQALIVVLSAYTISFFLLHLLPSNPVDLMLGPDAADVTVEEREALAARYGLDQPVLIQYFTHLFALVRGDLGYSFQLGRPVADVLGEALPSTLVLAGVSLLLALVLGLTLGFIAATIRSPWLSQILLSVPSLGVSIPSFWFGLVLIQYFSFRWQLFPAFNAPGPSGLVLPMLALAMPSAAMIAQVFARSLIDSRRQPFANAIRSKGAGYLSVQFRHVAHNALLPVLTVLGLVVAGLFGGTVIVETVFSRPGLGRVISNAVGGQDILVVLGAVLLGALLYTLTNLVVDLVYPLLDPRLRTSIRTGPRRARFGRGRLDRARLDEAQGAGSTREAHSDDAERSLSSAAANQSKEVTTR